MVIKTLIVHYLRGYIMKKMLINWLLPAFVDMTIHALKSMAAKSDNTVDDMLVDTVARERDKLIAEIKANL